MCWCHAGRSPSHGGLAHSVSGGSSAGVQGVSKIIDAKILMGTAGPAEVRGDVGVTVHASALPAVELTLAIRAKLRPWFDIDPTARNDTVQLHNAAFMPGEGWG
jgi:hypothetical protein